MERRSAPGGTRATYSFGNPPASPVYNFTAIRIANTWLVASIRKG